MGTCQWPGRQEARPGQRLTRRPERRACVRDLAGKERPLRPGRLGSAPWVAAGRFSSTTGLADKPRVGSWSGRASAPDSELAGRRRAPYPGLPPGPNTRGGGRMFQSRPIPEAGAPLAHRRDSTLARGLALRVTRRANSAPAQLDRVASGSGCLGPGPAQAQA